jgi:hypothetical protein
LHNCRSSTADPSIEIGTANNGNPTPIDIIDDLGVLPMLEELWQSSARILRGTHKKVMYLLLAAMALALIGITFVRAETPAQAYAEGCGGCHTSERAVLRKIPRVPTAERRAWIEAFMANHPCERDSLKPLIVEYLLEKTAR